MGHGYGHAPYPGRPHRARRLVRGVVAVLGVRRGSLTCPAKIRNRRNKACHCRHLPLPHARCRQESVWPGRPPVPKCIKGGGYFHVKLPACQCGAALAGAELERVVNVMLVIGACPRAPDLRLHASGAVQLRQLAQRANSIIPDFRLLPANYGKRPITELPRHCVYAGARIPGRGPAPPIIEPVTCNDAKGIFDNACNYAIACARSE